MMSFESNKKIKDKNNSSLWKITYHRYKPSQEGLRESLCTLGNGYLGTRGAAYESAASRINYPGTYIAGLYNKLKTNILGRAIYNDDLVNCPNWLFLTFKLEGGEWITPLNCKIDNYYQELDMRKGVLLRNIRIQDDKGNRFSVISQRIVHMGNPHQAAIKYSIISETYQGRIIVRSALDGTVENKGVDRYRDLKSKHFKNFSLGNFSKNGIFLSVDTTNSKVNVVLAARTCIYDGNKEIKPVRITNSKDAKRVFQDFEIIVSNNRYDIEKIVAIYTSKDKCKGSPMKLAINSVKRAGRFKPILEFHKKAWISLWEKYDIKVEGDIFSQKVLRLHTFHLLQTVSNHNKNIDAGVTARGLHGEAYRGHVFWDELFIMPFYDLRLPKVSKAILLYRYRRLSQARKAALKNGYKGAMFPWQSSSTGEEETQTIHLNPLSGKWGPDYSHNQRHVSFAIAYNVWQYCKRTRDIDFIIKYGAELLLSIAQFSLSLLEYNIKDKFYHTNGLMGPDEFHEKIPGRYKSGLKDNAYSNLMIVWVLQKSLKIADILPDKDRKNVLDKIGLTEEELKTWVKISSKVKISFNEEGIASQFDGYFDLHELNWKYYKSKYGNIQRMDRILKSEGKSPDKYKVSKQADFLMIFYLLPFQELKKLFQSLGHHFNKTKLRDNYEYYIKRTTHGSTLSKVVHSYIANLLGKGEESWKLFMDVLKSDIYDSQGGTTPEGIHTGVMGGSIVIAIKGFVGLSIMEDRIKIDPNLPKHWDKVEFKICYRKNWIFFKVTKEQIIITTPSLSSKPFIVPFEIYGKRYSLNYGEERRISLKEKAKSVRWGGSLKMAQERILIVEGDIAFAEVITSRLESLDYLVDCVSTGVEALDVLKNKWVDLVISSIVLKGVMNGYQLFKEIRKNNDYLNIPIIIQSGKPAMKNMFEYLGAEEFFVKPYSVEKFLEKVKSVFDRDL